MREPFRRSLVLLSLTGTVLSSVSTYNHYVTSPSSYCDLNATFNCDIVNRSSYSELFGIPVAGIGIAGYLLLLLFSSLPPGRTRRRLRLAFAIAGLCFALNLTYIEEHVLRTWCILCLGSLAAIFSIAVLSLMAVYREKKSPCKDNAVQGEIN